jgi:lipoate-protein ligase A
VAARTDDPALGGSAADSYRAIAQGLCRGLKLLGVPAELVRASTQLGTGNSTGSGTGAQAADAAGRSPSCFAASGRYELSVRGRKVLGSAQRRMGGTFLQQGSLLLRQGQDAGYFAGGAAGQQATTVEQELGRPVTFGEAAEAMERGCREGWGLTFEPLALSSEQLRSAEERATQHLIATGGAG